MCHGSLGVRSIVHLELDREVGGGGQSRWATGTQVQDDPSLYLDPEAALGSWVSALSPQGLKSWLYPEATGFPTLFFSEPPPHLPCLSTSWAKTSKWVREGDQALGF